MTRTLPLVIFGVLGIIAGIVALWLPETLYSPMAQTVEQVEEWDEDYKIYCCGRHGPTKEECSIGLAVKEEANENGNPTAEIPTTGKKYDSLV